MKLNREQLVERTNTFIGRHFALCAGAVIVLVFVVGWFALLNREYRTIRDSGVLGYEAAIEQLQLRQEHLFDLQTMEEQWNNLDTERLVQVNQVLPVGFETTEAINTVQGLATAANLTILSVDITTQSTAAAVTDEAVAEDQSSAPSHSPVRSAVVTLNVEAEDESDYEDLKYFLNVLQSYTPVFNMQSLNYSPDTTSYALQLVTYYVEAPASS